MSKTDLNAGLCTKDDRGYFSVTRWEIIKLIPSGNHKILDVGCGAGSTLRKLKELGKANEIVGIEINEDVARNSSDALDKLHIGDVETMDLPYPEKYFDYILFADVLEHLINPRRVLRIYRNLLRDDGYLIATIPNIKHYNVLMRLILFDEFRYSDTGILDRSHLRFFTKKEIIKMFQDEQFEVVDLIHLHVPIKPANEAAEKALSDLPSRLRYKSSLYINQCLAKSSFYAYQYLIKAKKGKVSR
jgi:2-polyprenyl-3-methyl-5-hydroxy-6-metoxy-1,4-benzoquinol methylase